MDNVISWGLDSGNKEEMLLLLRQKISCTLSPVPAGPNSQLLRWLCVISAAGNHHFHFRGFIHTCWSENVFSVVTTRGQPRTFIRKSIKLHTNVISLFSIKDTFRTCLIVLKLIFTNQLSVDIFYCQINKKKNTIWKTKSVQINPVLETKNSINGYSLQI